MVTNELFRECLSSIPDEQKAKFDKSFNVAERIDEVLKAKGLSYVDFAHLMGKRVSEISTWMTGRHSFMPSTIYRIEAVLGCEL